MGLRARCGSNEESSRQQYSDCGWAADPDISSTHKDRRGCTNGTEGLNLWPAQGIASSLDCTSRSHRFLKHSPAVVALSQVCLRIAVGCSAIVCTKATQFSLHHEFTRAR